ncbi:MAG: YaiI/YqxD family protein [Sumerlaeia bacterium]
MPPTIYIDADACPVKNEVYRVAERWGLRVILVANSPMRVPERDWVSLVLVEKKADAADRWITERAVAGDVVVTNDILLANQLIKENAAVPIAPNGKAFTPDNIGEALARRDFAEQLREWGGPETGPPPFTKADRSRFLHTLHAVLEKQRREKEQDGAAS